MNDSLKALIWFLKNNPTLLTKNHKIIVIRPYPDNELLDALNGLQVDYYQSFRPYAEILEKKGLPLVESIQGQYDVIIYLATKFKEENCFNFAMSCNHLAVDGCFIVTQANSLGAQGLEKHIATLFPIYQFSIKSKSRVYLCQRKGINVKILQDWLKLGELKPVPGSELYSMAGVFGWQKIDLGSRLLLETIMKDKLTGRGADLGSGYGYLSYHILKNFSEIKSLHLYEAEQKAIQASQYNIALLQPTTDITFHWADVTKGLLQKNLDWIVMNPPFHEGSNENVSIGRLFIEAAAKALKDKGILYMVANRHLPYEAVIGKFFRKTLSVIQDQGFKIVCLEK